jgi:hypothetical protein
VPRFATLVRDDFFAGMMGDTARLERGMEFTEEILAANAAWEIKNYIVARARQKFKRKTGLALIVRRYGLRPFTKPGSFEELLPGPPFQPPTEEPEQRLSDFRKSQASDSKAAMISSSVISSGVRNLRASRPSVKA